MTSTDLINMLQALLELARAGHAASLPVTTTITPASVPATLSVPAPSCAQPPVVVPGANVGPVVTKEQVKGAIVALANAKGRAAAEAILGNHGATHVDKLHDSRYAACFEDLQRAKAAT